MKRFILRCLLFSLVTLFMLLAFWNLIVANESKLLKTDRNIVILGNSTIEYGINDSILSNSLNLGLNGDHIEYMYAKLKLIKKYNPQVDTVLILLDNIIVDKDINDSHNSELMHPFYFNCYSLDDIATTIRHTPFKWFSTYLAKPFSVLKIYIPLKSYFNDYDIKAVGIGGYYHLDRDKLAQDIQRFAESKANDDTNQHDDNHKPNPIIIHFYSKLVDFCNKENITPIFITMPIYPLSPSYSYRTFHEQYFSDIPLMDFYDLKLNDSLWADGTHLNTQGATEFSKILNDSIHHGNTKTLPR